MLKVREAKLDAKYRGLHQNVNFGRGGLNQMLTIEG